MFRLRTLMIFLTGIALVACGESMRSNQLDSNNLNTNYTGYDPVTQGNYFNPNGYRNSQTPLTIDERVAQLYALDFQQRPNGKNEFVQSVRAFDIIMETRDDSDVILRSRITRGCGQNIEHSQRVNANQLASGQIVDFGTRNNHRVRLQCTDSICREMVAAVSTNTGIVLLGMTQNGRVEDTIFYIGRQVNLLTHHLFMSGSLFNNQTGCDVRPLGIPEPQTVGEQVLDFVQEGIKDWAIDEGKELLERIF